MIWLALSAAMMVVTALYHSGKGEANVVGPLLALDAPLLQSPPVRRVVRWAWHLASYFMALFAAVVLWPGAPRGLIVAVGAAWLLMGVALFVAWRGRHRGSLMLMAAGLLALVGALT